MLNNGRFQMCLFFGLTGVFFSIINIYDYTGTVLDSWNSTWEFVMSSGLVATGIYFAPTKWIQSSYLTILVLASIIYSAISFFKVFSVLNDTNAIEYYLSTGLIAILMIGVGLYMKKYPSPELPNI